VTNALDKPVELRGNAAIKRICHACRKSYTGEKLPVSPETIHDYLHYSTRGEFVSLDEAAHHVTYKVADSQAVK